MKAKFVNMNHVIGDALAEKHNILFLQYEDVVKLGQHALKVFKITDKLEFPELCEIIVAYIKTPFGAKVLRQLAAKAHE